MATAGLRLDDPPPGLPAASKVPPVTAWFWVISVLAAGMGEATSDYLIHLISPVAAAGIAFAGLAATLSLQVPAARCVPWAYWLTVTMAAVSGSVSADAAHVWLGFPYQVSTAVFAVALALILAGWHAPERALSIHVIRTRRGESYYWAAALATFALGTAASDLAAYSLRLGYLASGLLFCIVITAPAFWYWLLGRGGVAAFWAACVVTRPLGASFAGWLGLPPAYGGAGLAPGAVSVALALVIAALAGYLTVSGGREPRTGRAHWHAAERASGGRAYGTAARGPGTGTDPGQDPAAWRDWPAWAGRARQWWQGEGWAGQAGRPVTADRRNGADRPAADGAASAARPWPGAGPAQGPSPDGRRAVKGGRHRAGGGRRA